MSATSSHDAKISKYLELLLFLIFLKYKTAIFYYKCTFNINIYTVNLELDAN